MGADPIDTRRTVIDPVSTHRWTAQGRHYYQGLYPLPTPTAGLVGVRVTVTDATGYPEHSGTTAEVFDGIQWHVVAALPGTLMRSLGSRQDDELLRADIQNVLQDVSLAYAMRAPGPNIRVDHQPPAEVE